MRTNVFVRDMDLGAFNLYDTRRLEVVVNGLPLFGGAQLVVGTTLVGPLTREGEAKPRAATVSGACLAVARRRKEGGPSGGLGWRGWRPVLVGNSPFPEVPGFRQSARSATNPARQGACSVAQEVEFDVGLRGSSRLCSLTVD